MAKAKADVILISGADGGTGASPLSSIRHAGLPWEMGLAEAHQTLVKNNLRSRITLQTDGKIMTGKDLAVATLLGAEEYGISTAALIVEGCIMMRKCHLNTCPVGIATQRPELRALFTGDPDHVVNFFTFLVMEFREIMAELGFRTVNEMVGQSYVLKQKPEHNHWKINKLDLNPVLHFTQVAKHIGIHQQIRQDHELKNILDKRMIQELTDSDYTGSFEYPIKNTDRATGTMLSHHVTRNLVNNDLIEVKFRGSAGQSFAAFLAKNLRFKLYGEANDYVAKGLSGGTVIIQPDKESKIVPHENIIIGNVCMYGATSGELFVNGMAGERFCVRNSGATAVVEGIGDHGCEYMTGGLTIVLGEVGNNFGAGMSGGIAYIWNKNKTFEQAYNPEMIGIEGLESDDLAILQSKLQDHIGYTNSPLATAIIDHWEVEKMHFIKVIPFEYKKVLESKTAKEELL